MPNIEEFSAGNIDIRPTETGVESVAAAGRRMGAYGSQIAASYQQIGRDVGQAVDAAQKYLEHREINTGAKQAADLTVSKNQSWNDYIAGKDIPQDATDREDQINARISNPNAAQEWREKTLEPDLQQFRNGFLTPGGREWADHFVNQYREHMAVKTASDQSSMAGAVVQANIEKTTNALAATTFSDPSSLRTNIDLLSHSIEGSIQSSPTLLAEHRIKVSTELKQKTEEKLVQAAIQGAILKGGDWKAIANDPAYSQYVKPAENAQFERMEKTYQKGQQVADKQIQLLNRQIAETNQEQAMQQSFARNVKTDDAGNITIDPQYIKDMTRIAITSGAPKAVTAAEAQINWADKVQKNTKVINDPATYSDLRGRVFNAEKPTSEIEVRTAMGDGKIDYKSGPKSGPALIEMIKARDAGGLTKDPQFKFIDSYVKQVVEGSYGGAKYDEDGKYQQAMLAVMNEYNKQKAAGTLQPNALNVSDEKSLIRTAIEPFKQTLQGAITNNGGVTIPPLPVYTAPVVTPAAAATAPGAKETTINSKAEYDKLAPGTPFTYHGKKFTKPTAPAATLGPGEM